MLTPEVKDKLCKLHPEVLKQLEIANGMTEEAADPALLELCSSYIDCALTEQAWHPPGVLTEREKAFLTVTEQFVSSVSNISDEQIQRLQAFAPADEVYLFINALYLTEMTKRMGLVAGRVLL